jgi:hypothetical protein
MSPKELEDQKKQQLDELNALKKLFGGLLLENNTPNANAVAYYQRKFKEAQGQPKPVSLSKKRTFREALNPDILARRKATQGGGPVAPETIKGRFDDVPMGAPSTDHIVRRTRRSMAENIQHMIEGGEVTPHMTVAQLLQILGA